VLIDRWSALVGSQMIGWHRRWRTVPVELASAHLRREGQRLLDLARSAA
jgi:hypothetical protein